MPPTLGLYPTFDKALEHGFIGMGLPTFKNWQKKKKKTKQKIIEGNQVDLNP
jgi:hypothetical protein